jgi:hypothetical protein
MQMMDSLENLMGKKAAKVDSDWGESDTQLVSALSSVQQVSAQLIQRFYPFLVQS